MVAPRMFCDICDIFDLHETEDCPRQAMDSPPPPQRSRRVGKKKTEERPYCEICEGESEINFCSCKKSTFCQHIPDNFYCLFS